VRPLLKAIAKAGLLDELHGHTESGSCEASWLATEEGDWTSRTLSHRLYELAHATVRTSRQDHSSHRQARRIQDHEVHVSIG
jgi:hypothetical protein